MQAVGGLDVSEKYPVEGEDLESERVPEGTQVCQTLVSPWHDTVMDQASTGRRRVGRIASFRVGAGMVYKVV